MSGNYLVNLPKCWQVGKFPKSLRILTWHYFQLPWVNGKFPELPVTSFGTSQNAGKLETFHNSFGFWHDIIFQLPWVNGKFPEVLGTSLGTCQNAGKLETSQNPFGFWHDIFCYLPWINGKFPEPLGNFPKCRQVGKFSKFFRILT